MVIKLHILNYNTIEYTKASLMMRNKSVFIHVINIIRVSSLISFRSLKMWKREAKSRNGGVTWVESLLASLHQSSSPGILEEDYNVSA